jgi:benzoate/toluate 1,2-dioxygenase beta subunit
VLASRDNEVDVRYNFNTLNHRYKITDQFFGTIYVTLRKVGGRLLISNKKIALKNDYIRQVLDVYHV